MLDFNMLDEMPSENRAAQKLEGIYHKGQKDVWNGRAYLQELLEKHGGVNIPDHQRDALRNVFAVILWGELAAWKISSALALKLDTVEARMAATSQAHDEARHFYVMRDYLAELGEVPKWLKPNTQKFLESVLHTKRLAHMLIGMQLMVEPLALTLFKLVRRKNFDPVLSDLLVMYEKDEARHVGLGVLYLPTVLKSMSWHNKVIMILWQFREYMRQFAMLREMEEDFEVLGITAQEVFSLAREKQFHAIRMTSQEMGALLPAAELLLRIIDARATLVFSKSPPVDRLKSAYSTILEKKRVL